MKVAVLTTSYPRYAGDAAGRFVADAVRHVRQAGVEVEVASPATFRHFGIAYGAGVVGNLRANPARALVLPAMLSSVARAARRAARDADLVHAHWLPAGAVALTTGKPFVVQIWGTDVELARHARPAAAAVIRRARLVICASSELAAAAQEFGAREVRIIPSGVELPADVGEEAVPPEVLFAGRLSREKGILELVQAAAGMNLVVAGDGPLRDRVPSARGFVPHHELGVLYERAAVVACPSHREGFGVACAEAMAHGKPVVASSVGGLRDLVVDGETGLVVPARDVGALRQALQRLLDDPDLRRKLGAAARQRAADRLAWPRVTALTLEAYEHALHLA
jgi:glycosyltransferase involved in cell wall biosynthesis